MATKYWETLDHQREKGFNFIDSSTNTYIKRPYGKFVQAGGTHFELSII